MAYTLCQQANIAAKVDIVDIAFDDQLFTRYGVTIPVMSCNGNELNWPFDLQELQDWLEINGITYNK